MASSFGIKFDVSQLDTLADKLAGLTPDAVSALMVSAINETADTGYELSRKAILRGINLTDRYVQSHMAVHPATVRNPQAEIVAFGGKGHITGLSHYGAMQEDKPVTWSNERIQEAGHTFSTKWPGWIRRRGDDARGIDEGDKTAGVSVQVTGARKALKTSRAILLPGIRDTEGNAMVFKRVSGSGRNKSTLKNLTGPSVYQLFRVAGALIENKLHDDLERAVVDAAEQQFLKELA